MHLEAALLLLFLPALCLTAESCTRDADCMRIRCAGGRRVLCRHPDGSSVRAADGVCACTGAPNTGPPGTMHETLVESKRGQPFYHLFHRNGNEGIVGSKHVQPFYYLSHRLMNKIVVGTESKHGQPFYHLLPSSTETSQASKQKRTEEKDYMNSVNIDTSRRVKANRTQRSTCVADEFEHPACDGCGFDDLVSHIVCNGIYECPWPYKDEANCVNRTCPLLYFQCDTVLCLSIEKRCDGETNCRDNTDESNCGTVTCPDRLFRCNSGQCVFQIYRCDKIPHCNDKSDETNCPQQVKWTCNVTGGDYLCPNGNCMKSDIRCDDFLYQYHIAESDNFRGCSRPDEMSCAGYYDCYHPGYAQCNSGHCIDRIHWCDTYKDCIDGSDETSCYNHTCPEPTSQYFQCKAGHCIGWGRWCDIDIHCPDGSDENACQSHTCDNPDYEFHCDSGHCITSLKRCDNRLDCPDGSDETECDGHYTVCPMLHYHCTPDECLPVAKHCAYGVDEIPCEIRAFGVAECGKRCPDGFRKCRIYNENCILYNLYCNGVPDCADYCNGVPDCDGGLQDDEDPELCQTWTCPHDYFQCSNGECMSHMFICEYMYSYEYARYLKKAYGFETDKQKSYDFVKQRCPDVFNKFTCKNHTCIDLRAFHCDSGHCIEEKSRCDQRSDCPDGSDEVSCENHTCIDQRAFQCDSGHCMEEKSRCNFQSDCSDGSDEVTCDTHTCMEISMFQCKSGHCVPGDDRCDIKLDCLDESDEMDCSSENIICSTFSYRCHSGQCYDTYFQCDGSQYCPDNSDENNCLGATCPDDLFRCSSGQCVPYHIRCNDVVDCGDGSDENGCPETKCTDSYPYRCADGRCISRTFICDAAYWNTSSASVCSDAFTFVSCENYKCIDPSYFQCKVGHCIDLHGKCNGVYDCIDGSDEEDCYWLECDNGQIILQLAATLICNLIPECDDWSDEADCSDFYTCTSSDYKCKTGWCISIEKSLCKGYFTTDLLNYQCALYFEDEKYCPFLKCPTNYLRMPAGDCAQLKSSNISCSTSTTPSQCEHNNMRCPNDQYYIQCCDCQCIHRVSICDGVEDCPDGADESNCGVPDCREDQFYCTTLNCFPSQLRCDGYDHCPDKQDEANCKLSKSSILSEDSTTLVKPDPPVQPINDHDFCRDPSICFTAQQLCTLTNWSPSCITSTGNHDCFLLCDTPCTCKNVGIMRCNQWNKHTTLKLDSNTVWPFNTSSRVFSTTFIDKAVRTKVDIKQWFFTFETMSEISITHASLTDVPTRLLSCALNIHHLDLSHNAITHVNVGDFGHLYRLSILDLSSNMISTIEDFSFKGIRVRYLYLKNNTISSFGKDLFSGMALDGNVYVDEDRFCCLMPEYFPQQNCKYSKADRFSSCKDLMKNSALGVMLWIVGFLALIGNVGILIYKIFVDKEKLTNFGVMVINLALADALMGVYLLSIASVDVMYRGIYIAKDHEWRNSIGCNVLGVLCTLSSEASVLFICLITLDRYLITKYPFRQVRISKCMLIIICISIWIFAATIATTPFMITSYFNGKYYSTSGVCNALPLTKESFDGWEFSFAINVCLNCFLFLIVGVGQLLIFIEVRESRGQSLVSTRHKNDMKIARKLMYIVISDFFCWVPIGVLGMLALGGIEINPDAYAWVTVFVLPVNSAVNPFLYTLLSLFSDWKKSCRPPTGRSEPIISPGQTLSRKKTY